MRIYRESVRALLNKDIQHLTILIHGPPEIMAFAIDGDKHFIEKSRVTGTRPAMSNFLGVLVTELETPLAHSFIGDDNAACNQ
jgi:hypothetical protein